VVVSLHLFLRPVARDAHDRDWRQLKINKGQEHFFRNVLVLKRWCMTERIRFADHAGPASRTSSAPINAFRRNCIPKCALLSRTHETLMSSSLVGPRCTSRTISLWLLHTLCRTCFGFQTLSCQDSNSAPNVFLDLSGLLSPTRTTHTNSEGSLRSTWWVDWRGGISLPVKLINN